MKTFLNYRIKISMALFFFVVGLALLPIQANAVPGEGALYGTSPSELIIINPNTGASTVVGDIADGPGFPGFAIDTLTGWGLAGCGAGCDQMWNVDLLTGMGTLLGSLNGGIVASGLDFSSGGVLYASLNMIGNGGSGGDHLATINTLTGEATVIGPYGVCNETCTLDGIEAIAFDAQGNLWGSLRSSPGSFGTPGMYLINPNTGQASFVAPILDSEGASVPRRGVVSLQFACDGTLYGGTSRSGDGALDGGFLVTINPNTGLFSYVGGVSATGGQALGGLAFERNCSTDVPTLSEWGLISMAGVLGLLSLFILLRKRERIAST